MKIRRFDNEQDWLDARKGKITGTRAGNLISVRDKKPLKGYYELLAERVAVPITEENAMDRGKRLEDEAVERYIAETGVQVKNDLVLWERDDHPDIAISPDAYKETKKKKVTVIDEAVEVKCLSSASHIEAWITKQVPSEYRAQARQYFIVNDDLIKLTMVFYDPRMPIDFFTLELTREDMLKDIEEFLAVEKKLLEDITEIERQLTF